MFHTENPFFQAVVIEINGHANLIIHHNEKLKFKSYLNTFVPSVDARISECSIPAHSSRKKMGRTILFYFFSIQIYNPKMKSFFFLVPERMCKVYSGIYPSMYTYTLCVCQVANSHSNYIHKA